MATASKAQHRSLSFPTAAGCRPAVTPSLISSRRHDSATDPDSLDLDGCIHDSMRDSGLSPAAFERVVSAVGCSHGLFQVRAQRTIGFLGEGGGVRWLS